MPKFSALRRRSIRGDPERDDPLSRAIAPPENESQEEYAARLATEEEAQKCSDAIDEEINRQRLENKRAPKSIRVLLLGQSESGKSTTLKNFQLIDSSKAFRHERASWRAVIQLNIVRSIRLILDLITEAHAHASGDASPAQISTGFPRLLTESADSPPIQTQSKVTPDLLKLRMRLLPLQQVEESLLRKMTPAGSAEFEATHLSPMTNRPYKGRSGKFKEVAINSTAQWKGAFGRLIATARASMDSAADIDFEDPNDPGVILNACAEDISKLWNDPTVKSLLKAHRIRLESMSGFFLDSINRVTGLRYIPTDDDILRARLKTLGVSEHRFTLKSAGSMVSHDWRVYDVGVHDLWSAWAPYFDDLDAIIFLAPLSGFDEVLVEDPSVNKLEDSILLWKHVVSNPLLKNTQIVLFLNKIDLFRAKLEAGIRFSEFVVSYGARSNDYESTSNYIRKKFGMLLKQHSPVPRIYYSHLTSMTDSKSTQHILVNVKDMVIREMLQKSSLV
ncbi:guanine nucleotide-binding protein alpha-4 subunit [Gymnopilus junonius]|uniref:Guanine nucleotide-binding protein alpha-4 subunit n=1 Tax=Gymnopilus junonius TaxID=109634 RepID=A0A9P5TR13_GYMJU|nr:guanine nucleotide-binding protein alpha-4 subunit [Gymnopilus junonius]